MGNPAATLDMMLMMVIALLVLIFISILYYSRYCGQRPDYNAREDEIPHSFIVRMLHTDVDNTVTRLDLTRSDKNIARWVCQVCEFTNNGDGKTCLLCGTKPGEEINYKFAASCKASIPMLSSSAYRDSNHRSAPIDILSDADLGASLLQQDTAQALLNSRQQYARKRREWERHVTKEGTAAWKHRNIFSFRNKAKANATKNAKQESESLNENQPSTLPCISSSCAPIDTLSTSNGSSSIISMTSSSSGFITRMVPSLTNSAGRLTFQNAKQVNAAEATLGTYGIKMDEFAEIQSLYRQSFSKKYEWFLEQMQLLSKSWTDGRIKIRVRRESILVDSMEQILGIDLADIHLPLRVEFIDEVGIDAGGLQREWYGLLFSKLFDPAYGLFIVCHRDNQSLCLNPNSVEHSPDHLLYFRGVGRLLGRALLDGYTFQARFALPILKHILGVPITFSDMQYVDPEVYSSMKWIRDNAGVEALGLTFAITCIKDGQPVSIDLKPQGQDITVTDENKMEYLYHRLRYYMLDRYSDQLQALSVGFMEVIPQGKLMAFDYKELELIMCGLPQIHVSDWKEYTVVTPSSFAETEVVRWFWEAIEDLSQEDCARFLQFCTGSSRVPVQGFKALTSYDGRVCPFTIRPLLEYQRGFPKVHTCFNRIELPLYQSREELSNAISMLLAMQWTEFSIE